MTIYAVDIHTVTHTCPADPEPHPIDIRRRIVHVTPGRDCLTPITYGNGTTMPCGQRVPYDRQCANCRTIITVRTVTTEHLGYQGPTHRAPTPAEVNL